MVNTRVLKTLGNNSLKGSSPFTPTNLQLNYCAELAMRSGHPKHRHVAVILYQYRLVCWANNNHNYHAEVKALETAHLHGYKKNLTLISVSVRKDGKLRLAKPCISCEWYAKKQGVTCIYYSTNQQTIVRMKK